METSFIDALHLLPVPLLLRLVAAMPVAMLARGRLRVGVGS